jgi:hypothetical protein
LNTSFVSSLALVLFNKGRARAEDRENARKSPPAAGPKNSATPPARTVARPPSAGGLVVSLFAVVGDVLRPKSFAGLFGAAPSVALATLTLAFWKDGRSYVSVEGRSMILGAIALAAYSLIVCQLLMRLRWSALAATTAAVIAWLVIAIGLEQLLLG